MKSYLAFAVLAGVAVCLASGNSSSTSYYGWAPNKELTYRFESQVLTGIPNLRDQYAGLELSSDVIIQTNTDYSLRIKFRNPKFISVNGDLEVIDGQPQMQKATQELPEELKSHLTTPFTVHIKKGVVEALFVEKSEPAVVTNIKKALLTQMQLDLTASGRKEILSPNSIVKGEDGPPKFVSDDHTYFTTEESSVAGDCQTSYTFHPLPKYQAVEIENRIESNYHKLKSAGIIEGERSEGDEICKGKDYFEITKTKHFDNCRQRPSYQSIRGIKVDCDYTKAECKELMTQMSTSRYIVCGTPREFHIREAQTTNEFVTNPLSWSVTPEERMVLTAKVTLMLLKIKSKSTPFPEPRNAEKKKSLIYEFPRGDLWSSHETREIAAGEENDKRGYQPILPMPDMHSGTGLAPKLMPIQELTKKVVEEMEKIVREIFESPESCPSKSDVAGYVHAIAQALRPLSLQDIEQIDRALSHSISGSHEHKKIASELWHDILAMTATNACASLVKRKVESGELHGAQATRVLQSTLRNIKTPTQELLKEMFELVKSLRSSQRSVYNVALIQLANLIQHACVDPTTRTTQFPVRTYGLFCTRDSDIVAKKFVPYLVQQLESSNDDSAKEKLIYIAALGKVGTQQVIVPLARVIERNTSPMVSSVAVYSLKRVAVLEPAVVRPILLKIIDNPADVPEVRIAAIAVLPWTQPSTAQLQKIAVRTWFEPSKQVASFMFSTLKSLTVTKIPELIPVGLKVKGLETLVKPFRYGVQFSHSVHTQNFVEYLKALSSVESTYVNSAESLIPARISISNQLYGGSWQMDGLTFSVYTNGMEHLVDKIIAFYDYESTTSHAVKEELSQLRQNLNLKPKSSFQRQQKESFVRFSIMGMHRVYAMNNDPITEILEKVAEEMRFTGSHSDYEKDRSFNLTYTNYAIKSRVVLPSMAGFPIIIRRNVPFVVAVKGNLYYKMERGIAGSELSGTIVPVLNGKVQCSVGVVSPFEKKFVGAGVEASLHYSLALTAKVSIPRHGEVELSLKSPRNHQSKELEAIHAFVVPFTVIKKLDKMVPLTKSGDFKEILSGEQIKSIHMPLGRHVGVDARLKIEADYRRLDFPLFWEKLSQQSVLSIGSLVYMPISARKSSFKIEFNPSSSETKEIKAKFYMVNGKRTPENDVPEVHFPSRDDIHESKDEEIRSLCRKSESPSICEAKMMHNVNSYRTSHGHVHKMLERASFVKGINVDASFIGGSSSHHKTVQTTVLVGGSERKERKEDDYKSFVEIKVRTPGSSGFELDVKAEAKLPEMPYRWDVQSMIRENIKMDTKLDIEYGYGGEKKQIRLEAELSKSEALKESVRQSPELRKCEEEISKGRELSSVCVEARHQAASVDKIVLKADLPNTWSRKSSRIVAGIESYLASYLWPVMVEEEWQRTGLIEDSGSYSYEFEALVNRTGEVAQAWVKIPHQPRLHFKNVTLPRGLRGVFPVSLRNGVASRIVQKVTRSEVPASCRIDSRQISTFDNKTYEYKMSGSSASSNCGEHLLFKDCSAADLRSKIPAAVTARQSKSSPDHQDIKILTGENKVELKYQSGSVEIVINGQTVEVQPGQTYEKNAKNLQKKTVVLAVHRYSGDKVVRVENPRQGLMVFYDGKKIEVVAPQLLHNRACGLCGDLNGENTADLKSAGECVMRHPRFAAYTYTTGGDRCVPEEDRTEFEHDKRECLKQKFIFTRVEDLAKRLVARKNIPISAKHVVEVTQNHVCVSKTMIRVCGKHEKPVKMERVELSFACLTRGYSNTHQILKRANAGEQIIQVRELPTEFSKKQMQPVECKRQENETDYDEDSSEERRHGSGSSEEEEREIEKIEEKLQKIKSKISNPRIENRTLKPELERLEQEVRHLKRKDLSGRKMQKVERIEREIEKLMRRASNDNYNGNSSEGSSEEVEQEIEKIEEKLQRIKSKIHDPRIENRTLKPELERLEQEVKHLKRKDLSGRKMQKVEKIEREIEKLMRRASNDNYNGNSSEGSSEEEEREIEKIEEKLQRIKSKINDPSVENRTLKPELERLEQEVKHLKRKDLSGRKMQKVEKIERQIEKLMRRASNDNYNGNSNSSEGSSEEEEREIEKIEEKLQRIKSKINDPSVENRTLKPELERLEQEVRELKRKDLGQRKMQEVEKIEREIRKLKKRISNDYVNRSGSGSSEEEQEEIQQIEEELQRIKSKINNPRIDNNTLKPELERLEQKIKQLKRQDLSGRKMQKVEKMERELWKLKERASNNDSSRSGEGSSEEEQQEIERIQEKLQRIKSKINDPSVDNDTLKPELERLEQEIRQLKRKNLSGRKMQEVEQLERQIWKLKKRASHDDSNRSGEGSSEEEIERIQEKLQRIKSKINDPRIENRTLKPELDHLEQEVKHLKRQHLSGRKMQEVEQLEREIRQLKERANTNDN